MNPKYTNEQIADIQGREAKAIAFLKEIEMTISAQVVSVNVGDNTFAQKVIPYISDLKFSVNEGDVKSPIEVVEGEIIEPKDESVQTN